MTLTKIMHELQGLGTAQNQNIYLRRGASEAVFGVSFADLKKVGKAIKRDHELAQRLWGTGNHDARILATMVADPSQADEKLLESWVRVLGDYVVTDAFSTFAGATAFAGEKADQWSCSEDEWIGRSGWRLVALFAMKDAEASDEYLLSCLDTIEGGIHTSKNMTKDAMNSALIAIGIRNEKLEKRALEAAARIGKVEVDHGQTGCKTPAAAYIQKPLGRRNRQPPLPSSPVRRP